MKKPKALVWYLVTLLAGLSLYASAQKSLTKIVVDAKTKAPLDFVFIQSDDGGLKQLSTKEGKFVLLSDVKAGFFSFYKIGYAIRKVTTASLLAADTVFLSEKIIELGEVVIKSNKIDTVVKDKRYYVDDYKVLPNGNFLLITSMINVSGCNVCYYSRQKGICKTHKIKNENDAHFVTDCFKNIHLVTAVFSRQVYFDSDSSFDFLPKYTRKAFDSILAPCELKIDSQVIVKRKLPPITVGSPDFKNSYSPLLMYDRVSRRSSQLFYVVTFNEQIREMVAWEVADWIMIYGKLNERTQNNMNLFFRKVAGPIYAPLFLKNDTVILFNFQEQVIVFLSKTGKVISEVKLNRADFGTIHDFEIIYDLPVQKFYMKMKESDRVYLKTVNIYSGTASKKVKLEKPFASNLQVVNDRIYYLVKEKNWDDTQYLYQQN